MKKHLLLFSLFTFHFSLYTSTAQNLVPNSSFEDTIACPNSIDEVLYSTGWNKFGNGTPDYFNSCASNIPGNSVSVPQNDLGYQYPANGNAYCGFYSYDWSINNYREYIGRQLSSPLIIGQNYYITFKVNLSNIDTSSVQSCNCASDKLGILFTTTSYYYDIWEPSSIKNFAHIYTNTIVSDTLNWTIIHSSFIADSAYKYITIGNFFSDTNTNIILLKGTKCIAYYFVDEICVSTDSLTCNPPDEINENKFNVLKIFPNPASDEINIDISESYKNSNVIIYNVLGEKIKEYIVQPMANKIDISNLYQGVYFIQINFNNKTLIKKIVITKN
jgi:hypothetical protein